jgi:hypothetical protein
MIVYDPRARYLTGLLGWPSYDPRRRYLTGMGACPRTNLLGYAKRNSRRNNLGADVQLDYIPYTQVVTGPDGSRFLIQGDAQGNVTSTPIDSGVQAQASPGSITGVITAIQGGGGKGPIVGATPTSATVTSFLNQQSIQGIPNGALLLGLGVVAVIASSGGKRR